MSHLDLPEPVAALLPELLDLPWDGEALATCEDCAMQARPGEVRPSRVTFTAPARCCTYAPRLPNWLAGRALLRGGAGAERIRARLEDPTGLAAPALGPTDALRAAWLARDDDAFGRNTSLTCPYWQEGAYGCAVHPDRNGVCRTWFCRTEAGARGHAAWMALKAALVETELALAERAVAGHDAPQEGAEASDWAAWYVGCAERVEGLSEAELEAVRGPRIDALVERAGAALERRHAPMPRVLLPNLREWTVEPGAVAISSWSPFDVFDAPPWIFTLLSKLDGERTWREAQREAQEELGVWVPDDLVLAMYQRGLLGPAEAVEGSSEPVFSVLPG